MVQVYTTAPVTVTSASLLRFSESGWVTWFSCCANTRFALPDTISKIKMANMVWRFSTNVRYIKKLALNAIS